MAKINTSTTRSQPITIGHSRLLLSCAAREAMGEVADIQLTQGATSIRTENAKLATYIFVDIRDRDLGDYVECSSPPAHT